MMMMMFSGSSSRLALRRLAPVLSTASSSCARASFASTTTTPAAAAAAATAASHQEHASRRQHLAAVAAVATAAAILSTTTSLTGVQDHHKTYNAAQKPPPIGGELIQTAPPVKEPKTGILFPVLCNGYSLAGVGVRIKWGLIQVYAVGTYFDPLAMSAIKKSTNTAAIEQALLDPTYPRTIRIVMARGLSMQKFTDSIAEALEPRMKGQDLDKLQEFKDLNPPIDLVSGAEIEMTIRGDTLLYKNAMGGVGTIRSAAFTRALCDTYFGSDPVSPSHKAAVLEGIPKL